MKYFSALTPYCIASLQHVLSFYERDCRDLLLTCQEVHCLLDVYSQCNDVDGLRQGLLIHCKSTVLVIGYLFFTFLFTLGCCDLLFLAYSSNAVTAYCADTI